MKYPVITTNHIGSSFYDKLGTSKTILFPIVSALGVVLFKYTNTTGLTAFPEVNLKFYNSTNTSPKGLPTGETELNLDADGYTPYELQKSSAGTYTLRLFDSSANVNILPGISISGQTNIYEGYPEGLMIQQNPSSLAPFPGMQGTNYYGDSSLIIGRKRRVKDIDDQETIIYEQANREISGKLESIINFFDSTIFPKGYIKLENPYISRAFASVTQTYANQYNLKVSTINTFIEGDIARCINAEDEDGVITHWICLGRSSYEPNVLQLKTKSGFLFRMITSTYISPEHFGCSLNAQGDSTPAINKAIEACNLDPTIKKIVLNGNYVVNSDIFQEGIKDVAFEGGCIYLYKSLLIKEAQSIYFSKVRFRSRPTPAGLDNKIILHNVEEATFSECAFEDFKGSIEIKSKKLACIQNCFFLNGADEIIKINKGSKDLVMIIEKNFFSNCLGRANSLIKVPNLPKWHSIWGNIFKSCSGFSLISIKDFDNLFVEFNGLVNCPSPFINPDPLPSTRDTFKTYLGIVHLKKIISSCSVENDGLINLFRNNFSKHHIILNMCAVTGRACFAKLNQTITIPDFVVSNSRAFNNSLGYGLQGFNTSKKVENLYIANVTIDGSNNAKNFSNCENVNFIKETKNLYVDTKGRMSRYVNLRSGAIYEDNLFLRSNNSFVGGSNEFTHLIYLESFNPIKIVLINNTLETDGTVITQPDGTIIEPTDGSSSPLLYAFRVGNSLNHIYLTENKLTSSSQSIISSAGSITEDIEDLRLFKRELITASLTLSTDALIDFLEIYPLGGDGKPKDTSILNYCNEGNYYFAGKDYKRRAFSSPMRVSSISQEYNRPEIKFEILDKATRISLVNGLLKGALVCVKQTTLSAIAKGSHTSLDRFWYVLKIDTAEDACSLQLSNIKDALKGVFPPRAYTRDIVPSVGSPSG